MAKVLFVLGAGASRSIGVPVMAEFLDQAESLLRSQPRSIASAEFELAFKVLAALQVVHAKSVADLLNVESLFNLVEMGRLIGRLPGTSTPEEIEAAGKAVRRLLAQTIDRNCRFELKDDQIQPTGPYLTLATHIRKHQAREPADWAFVTFNYDLALDYALHWSTLKVDYGFQASAPVPDSVGLFKLHGSLNWTTCSCGEIFPVPWEHFHGLRPHRLDETTGYLPVTDRLPGASHSCGRQDTSNEPAIVPPSWNKTQYQKGFARVWSRAAAELAAAENIVVIGYSLPESDAFFHDLFRLGLSGPTRVRRFVVIDPSRDAHERFQALLGPELRVRFEPLDSTFEGYVDPNKSYPRPRHYLYGGPTAPERVADWIVRQSW